MLHKERNILNNNYFVRKNPRLKDYDYTLGGYYFITICTENKRVDNKNNKEIDMAKILL